ncbi:MAG: TonB-dependent receptor [Pseudomonadota bacterium]
MHYPKTTTKTNKIRTAVLSALVGVSSVSNSYAEVIDPLSLNMEAQPLKDALDEVSQMYDVSLIVSGQILIDKQAPAISGSMSTDEAIELLLENSGLVAKRSSTGAILIIQPLPARTEDQQNEILSSSIDPKEGSGFEQEEVEKIVVVGRIQQSLVDRIPISPQELPFTLNVIDREFIDQRNFTVPMEVVALLPNADLASDEGQLGNPEFIFRGYIATTLVNNRAQSLFRGTGGRDDSFVDRYEVLKGPASIALGPVDPGGIVNLVTKSPQAEDFAAFEFSTDQFGTIDGEFDFNTGAFLGSDIVSARLSGAYRDFQFDADQKFRETIAIRPVFDFDFSENTFVQLSISYNKTESSGNEGFPLLSDGSVPSQIDTDTFVATSGDGIDSEDTFIEGQLTHEFLDNLKLVLRGSRQDTSTDYASLSGAYNYNSDDGVPGISLNNPVVYFYTGYVGNSENTNDFVDLQLAANTSWVGQQQDIVIGTSYSKVEIDRQTNFDGEVVGINLDDINSFRAPPQVNSPEPDGFSFTTSELTSAYAEFAIRPNSWITVVGGVRYDHLEQTDRNDFFDETAVATDHDFTTRIGITAQVHEGISVYLSAAESFLPQTGVLESGDPVPPSTGTSYELGLKGAVFDNRISFSAAIFDTTRSDISVFDFQFRQETGRSIFRTVGEQQNRGFEMSVNAEPIDDLMINLNYGYLDIDILEAGDALNPPTSFAKNNANVLATYEFSSGSLNGLTVGAGVRYVGERDSDSPVFDYPEFTVVDALLNYRFSEKLSLALNLINVTDKRYIENPGFGLGLLTGGNNFGEPRTFRLSFRGKY